jgi:hypothetical protein
VQFVRNADTRQLLQTLEQLNRLSLTLAGLRKQQGRLAQAAAARRAAELLTAEQSRRTDAGYASIRGLWATPEGARRSSAGMPQEREPQLPLGRPGQPSGPTPAGRPGRTR